MDRRIFITGDKHGAITPFFGLMEKQELRETDIILITGDAGYVFYDDYKYTIETLEQLFPGVIAFIDGNHENFDILGSMPEETWCGGRVHRVSDRIYHMMRGELYDIYGNRFFVFGGARTTDSFDREEGKGWWPDDEEPTSEEIAYGQKQLEENLHDIEYVISHEAPRLVRQFTKRKRNVPEDYVLPDVLDSWYRKASEGRSFKRWFFGHMHIDEKIEPDLWGLHNEILLLETGERVKW